MKKFASCMLLAMLFVGMFVFAFSVQRAKAQAGNIYINSDGSITPSTANIITSDNVTYTFTGNITNQSIFVEKNSIILDGNGYSLRGTGSGTGIDLSEGTITNVTVKNIQIEDFLCGISCYNSSSDNIIGNNITGNGRDGIILAYSSGNVISENNIANSGTGITIFGGSWAGDINGNSITNNGIGIYLFGLGDCNASENNIANNTIGICYKNVAYSCGYFFHNNFINNTSQATMLRTDHYADWDDGYPSGGNYWSDYNGTDKFSGPYQNITGSDGIGDTPYVFNKMNLDRYPFMHSFHAFAHFSCSPTASVVNQTVTFTASSSVDLNGTIVGYAWDFGDGTNSTSTQPTVNHAYSSVGTFNVKLIVTDNYGFTSVTVKTLSVGRMSSKISIQVSPTAVTFRKSTRISGSISPSRPGVNVTIQYLLNGEGTWNFLANVTTDVNSTYSYTWIPSTPGNYSLEASWTGDEYTFPAETSTMTLNCVKIVTSISVSTSSSSSFIGFSVGIAGRLTDEYGSGLIDEPVVLYYTSYGVSSWTLITSDATDAFGNYSATWIPTATGTFTIKAEWAGNSTDSGVTSNVTLGCLPYKNQYVFSIESNSTISALAFNTTSMELSFTASGPTGTRGYTKVTIAKSLVFNATNIRVYLDGNQLQYSITSTSDSWLLIFNYTHSTHKVAVDLNVSPIPEFPSMTILPLFMMLSIFAAAILRRRNRPPTDDRFSNFL